MIQNACELKVYAYHHKYKKTKVDEVPPHNFFEEPPKVYETD